METASKEEFLWEKQEFSVRKQARAYNGIKILQ